MNHNSQDNDDLLQQTPMNPREHEGSPQLPPPHEKLYEQETSTVRKRCPTKKPRNSKAAMKKQILLNGNQTALPGRPLTAYNIFFRNEKQRILTEINKTITIKGGVFQSLAKQVAARWKGLSPEEMGQYKQLAEKDKRRYMNEMDEYFRQVAHRIRGSVDEDELSNDVEDVPFEERKIFCTESGPIALDQIFLDTLPRRAARSQGSFARDEPTTAGTLSATPVESESLGGQVGCIPMNSQQLKQDDLSAADDSLHRSFSSRYSQDKQQSGATRVTAAVDHGGTPMTIDCHPMLYHHSHHHHSCPTFPIHGPLNDSRTSMNALQQSYQNYSSSLGTTFRQPPPDVSPFNSEKESQPWPLLLPSMSLLSSSSSVRVADRRAEPVYPSLLSTGRHHHHGDPLYVRPTVLQRHQSEGDGLGHLSTTTTTAGSSSSSSSQLAHRVLQRAMDISASWRVGQLLGQEDDSCGGSVGTIADSGGDHHDFAVERSRRDPSAMFRPNYESTGLRTVPDMLLGQLPIHHHTTHAEISRNAHMPPPSRHWSKMGSPPTAQDRSSFQLINNNNSLRQHYNLGNNNNNSTTPWMTSTEAGRWRTELTPDLVTNTTTMASSTFLTPEEAAPHLETAERASPLPMDFRDDFSHMVDVLQDQFLS